MDPDNFAVHCDCQFASLDDVRAAVGFWFAAVREVIEIVRDEGEPWHCGWSSATGPGQDDNQGLADLATLNHAPDVPTGMGWDAMLGFEPGIRPRTGRDPATAACELLAEPVLLSATGDGGYEIEARVWLNRPWTRAEAAPLEQLLIRRLQAFVDQGNCSFACISDDLHDGLPLEHAQRRSVHQAREMSKRFLRNYSWVTYCSPELVQILDDAAPSSVEYPVVSRSAPGGAMLQLTPHLEDFVGDKVREAAALVAGAIDPRPATFRRRESSYRLLWSDGRAGPLPYSSAPSEST